MQYCIWKNGEKSNNRYLVFCRYHIVTLLWRQSIHNQALLQRSIYCILTWTSSVLVVIFDDLGEKTNLISFHMHLHYIQQYVYFIFSLFPVIFIYLWYCNYILLKYFHFKDKKSSKYQIDIFKYATFIKNRKEKYLEIPKEIDEQHKRIMTCAKRINVCHI